MRKISKGLSCTMVVLSILVSSFFIQFESSAGYMNEGLEFFVSYAEPACSDNQGYISLLLESSSSQYFVMTFFWGTYGVDNGVLSPTEMEITTASQSITFNVNQYGATGIWYTVSAINATGKYRTYAHSNSSSYTYDFSTDGDGYYIRGWKLKGNGHVTGIWNSYDFTIHFADGEAVTLMAQLSKLMDISNQLSSMNSNLGGKLDTLVSRVNALISEVDNVEETLISIKNLVAEYYPKFETELQNIVDRLDTLIEQSADDKNATDKFEEDSSTQSDKINDLNSENKIDKTDIDSASGSVDEYIDGDSIASYGTLLSVFTNNEYILRMILIVLAIGLISYVLFGKR